MQLHYKFKECFNQYVLHMCNKGFFVMKLVVQHILDALGIQNYAHEIIMIKYPLLSIDY